jgi:hypothetical protein
MTTISIPEYGTDEQQNETTHYTLVLMYFIGYAAFQQLKHLGDQLRTAFGNQNSMNSKCTLPTVLSEAAH